MVAVPESQWSPGPALPWYAGETDGSTAWFIKNRFQKRSKGRQTLCSCFFHSLALNGEATERYDWWTVLNHTVLCRVLSFLWGFCLFVSGGWRLVVICLFGCGFFFFLIFIQDSDLHNLGLFFNTKHKTVTETFPFFLQAVNFFPLRLYFTNFPDKNGAPMCAAKPCLQWSFCKVQINYITCILVFYSGFFRVALEMD